MKSSTILIKDEVNCKVQGLDLDTRRKLVNKFKYEVPYARHLPAVKLGRWDGKVGFFQLGGSTYINLLEEILPTLIEDGYDIKLDDRRDYQIDFQFDKVKEDSFSHVTWPKGHQFEGEPIILRDHQVTVINDFLENPQCLQEVATGAGKTMVTAALSAIVEPYGRSVVIVPNRTLVEQTEEDYVNMGLDVGVYFGGRKEYNRTHTICTWQSLNNMFKKSKDGEATVTIDQFLDGVVCVMVDEVHSAKADALKSMLTGPFSHIPIRWGLTGTIPKPEFEFRALQISLGKVIGQVTAAELQKKGILSNCHIKICQLIDHQSHSNYQSEQKYLLTNKDRLAYMASMIDGIADSGNTLVLVDRVAAGKDLVSYIGDRAVFVYGSTKANDRKEHYDEVAEVDGKIIVATYGVAAVGINVPRIFNLVLIEPGKSFVRVIQSIGRGVRRAKDKDFVQIWDLTSTCKYAKRHLTQRKKFYREAEYPFKVQKIDWVERSEVWKKLME